MEFASFPVGQVIYKPGESISHVYFPHNAMVSLVSMMEDGTTVEVGLVGQEGMVGIPALLGGGTTTNKAFVQVDT